MNYANDPFTASALRRIQEMDMADRKRFQRTCMACGAPGVIRDYGESFSCPTCGAHGMDKAPHTCVDCEKVEDECTCDEPPTEAEMDRAYQKDVTNHGG